MATGDKQVNIFVDRLLSKTALKEQFLDYLSGKIDDVLSSILQGTSGTLDSDKIGLAADGNDRIKLDVSSANKVVIGTSGDVVTLPDAVADATSEVDFENNNGTTYYVGVKYAQIPTDPDITPNRQGTIVYSSFEDSFGELDEPDSSPAPVDTPGVNLRLYINDITEVNVDNSGRTVQVWLVDPVSSVASIAIFEGTSGYDGTNNYIDIPYSGSNGPCGQDTSADPPSTTASDYRVFIKGVSIKQANISSDPDYAFIGTVLGNGPSAAPTVFDTSNQNSVFFNTLQKAYDGIGSGGGRVVLVGDGPVEARVPSAGPGGVEEFNSAVLIDAQDDTSTEHTIPLVGVMKDVQGAGGMVIGKIITNGTNLTKSNACSVLAANVIVKSGIEDFTAAEVVAGDYALLSGFTTVNGLFEIVGVSSSSLTLQKLSDGTSPGMAMTETGALMVIRPMFSVNNTTFAAGNSNNPHVTLRGHNVSQTEPLVSLYGHQQPAIKVFNDDKSVTHFGVEQDGKIKAPVIDGPIDHVGSSSQESVRLRHLECMLPNNGSQQAAFNLNPMGTQFTSRDGRWMGAAWGRGGKDPVSAFDLAERVLYDRYGAKHLQFGYDHRLWLPAAPATVGTDYSDTEFDTIYHPWNIVKGGSPDVRVGVGYSGLGGLELQSLGDTSTISIYYGNDDSPGFFKAGGLPMFHFAFQSGGSFLTTGVIEFGLKCPTSPFRYFYMRFDQGNDNIYFRYYDGGSFYTDFFHGSRLSLNEYVYGTIGLSDYSDPGFFYELYTSNLHPTTYANIYEPAATNAFTYEEHLIPYIFATNGGSGTNGMPVILHETCVLMTSFDCLTPYAYGPFSPDYETL